VISKEPKEKHRLSEPEIGNDRLRDLIKKNIVFATLSDSEIDILINNSERVSLKMGQIILRKGEPGSGFHIVLKGRVRVIDDTDRAAPVTLARLRMGASFGERSLLFDQPVSATVRCSSRVKLLSLSVKNFQSILKNIPSIRGRMVEQANWQIEYNFLRTSPIFSTATTADISTLLNLAGRVDVREGEIIKREADLSGDFFLVRSGQFKMLKGQASDLLIGFARPGQPIGSHSIIQDKYFGLNVVATEPSQLLVFNMTELLDVLKKNLLLWTSIQEWAKNANTREETIILAALAPDKEQVEAEVDTLFRQSNSQIGGIFLKHDRPTVQTNVFELGGIACLAAALNWFHIDFNLRHLITLPIEDAQIDSLHGLAQKAEKQGLMSRLVKIDANIIRDVPLPAVVQKKTGGYQLLWKFDDKFVILNDPIDGLVRCPIDEFMESLSGSVLSLAYVPSFGNSSQKTTDLFTRFWPLIRPHSRLFLNITFLTLVLQSLEALIPLFSETIVDDVVLFNDTQLLYLLLACSLASTFMNLIGSVVRQLLLMYATSAIGANLQSRFLAHILAVPVDIVGRWRVGELTLRFHENEKILNILSHTGVSIFVDLAAIAIFGSLLFTVSFSLALLGLFISTLIGGVLVWATPRIRAMDRFSFHQEEELQSLLIELVEGISTVKSLGKEGTISDRGIQLLTKSNNAEFRIAGFLLNVNITIEFLKQSATLLVMWMGARLVLQGSISTGALIAFSGLLGSLLNPIEKISLLYNELLKLRVSIDRVNEVLSLPTEAARPGQQSHPIRGQVRFQNVAFSYTPGAGSWTVAPTNLIIEQGQKVALVGASGSGKTTFVKLINRLLEPTEGKLFIDGVDISQVDVSSLRQQIGVVEQSPYIFAGTITENIAKAAPGLPIDRVMRAAKLAGASEFIDQFPMRYDTKVGEGGRVLSGGQAQRIIIARAIATDPAIMILDEATSALDTDTERLIQSNLDVLLKGRTTFIIAHRLTTIRNADIILVMDKGYVVEMGNHEDLMAIDGYYRRLATASGELT